MNTEKGQLATQTRDEYCKNQRQKNVNQKFLDTEDREDRKKKKDFFFRMNG